MAIHRKRASIFGSTLFIFLTLGYATFLVVWSIFQAWPPLPNAHTPYPLLLSTATVTDESYGYLFRAP
jgi:hypothetical protein